MGRRVVCMTRKEERLEKSRQRAEEHQRRRKIRLALFVAAVVLYVVTPLLWYGAIEFGLVYPIRTPEFKSAVNLAALVLIGTVLYLMPEFLPIRRRCEKEKPARPPFSSEATT